MKIEFTPFFLEEIVFLGIRQVESKGGDLSLYHRYQKEKDPLYELPEGEKEKAFRRLNIDFFSLLGYSGFIMKVIHEFPLLLKKIDRISFLKANKRTEEGADLFFQDEAENGENDNGLVRTLALKVLPDQFLNIGRLKMFFRREFLHVNDMLDNGFGYKPSLDVEEDNMVRYKLIQDRYRVLWQGYVDVRLSDRYPDYDPVDIIPGMERVFSGLAQEKVQNILDGLKSHKWAHNSLLNIAKEPEKNLTNSNKIKLLY